MFHSGERLAQQKAGYGAVRAAVYPSMPDQHRQFYAGLNAFYLSALDETGFPVAMRLQGSTGLLIALIRRGWRLPGKRLTTRHFYRC